MEYTIRVYTSRNTNRDTHFRPKTITEARHIAKLLCQSEMFPTGDFHDNPISKGKVSIETGSYPNIRYELWEFIAGHDKEPIKTEWN